MSSRRAFPSICLRPSSGGGMPTMPMRLECSSKGHASLRLAGSSRSWSHFAMSVWRAREAETAATYGSARWASQLEIRSAGLAGADGVILGRFEGLYLRHDGPEHVLCFAPTRSGKGVGLVVPTLLTWPGSCISDQHQGRKLDPDVQLSGPGTAGCCCLIQPIQGAQLTTLSWK